jgi:Ca2+:H+ antiporter
MKPSIELPLWTIGAPLLAVAILSAAMFGIVLLPEGLAAVRAALANRLQTSLNLALGSALASIGLTIPAVSFVSLYTNSHLRLGLDSKSSLLLMLSLFVSVLVLRTVFVVYLFTTVVP